MGRMDHIPPLIPRALVLLRGTSSSDEDMMIVDVPRGLRSVCSETEKGWYRVMGELKALNTGWTRGTKRNALRRQAMVGWTRVTMRLGPPQDELVEVECMRKGKWVIK